MQLQQNISLKPYNTFGIDVPAEYFTELRDIDDLPEVTELTQKKHVLGGGSNILLTQPVSGLVIHNKLKGITVEKENADYVWLNVQAGEVWHDLVLHAINNGLGGIENLALIPGTVGASPMQNIGAYGVELKDVLHALTCLDIQEKEWVVFSAKDCDFGYRSSVFKTKLKHRVVITSVTFRLTKKHQLHLEYGAIKDQLFAIGVISPTIKDISDAVIAIRTSKLPDPKLIGNAGSFFKNPVVTETDFLRIKELYPDLVSNPAPGGYKLAAGWLIEKTGWKGYREGHVGCYQKQALVLVNYGGAAGHEIVELSQKIQASVLDKFGVALDAEVNFI